MPPNVGGKKVLQYRVVLAWLACMMFCDSKTLIGHFL